jgi:hypothetical protein
MPPMASSRSMIRSLVSFSAKAKQLLSEANLPGECRISRDEPTEMRDTGLRILMPECGNNGCDL